MTDEWQYSPNSEWPERHAKSLEEDGEEWANMNAFLAYFTKHHDKVYWTNGFHALRDVLEPDDFERPDIWSDGVGLDVYLPSAAVWILISADLFWDVVKRKKETKLDDRYMEHMSLERWEEWKTAFQEIAGGKRGEVNERTRKLANDAAIEMEKIASIEIAS